MMDFPGTGNPPMDGMTVSTAVTVEWSLKT